MADLIDRDKLIDHIMETYPDWCVKPVRPIFDFINGMPSSDAVDVVRCADCKHSYESVAGWICSHGVCVDCVVRDDFYCSYGERNEAS